MVECVALVSKSYTRHFKQVGNFSPFRQSNAPVCKSDECQQTIHNKLFVLRLFEIWIRGHFDLSRTRSGSDLAIFFSTGGSMHLHPTSMHPCAHSG